MTIESRVDDGQPVVASDVRQVDVTVSGDGQHSVTATATDRAGNVSAPASLAVRIDATAPVSTATVDGAARAVTVTATDATSGVARIEYAIGTGAWTAYTGAIAAPDANRHTVSFRAMDEAGNLETARTVIIPADLSGPLTGNIGPIATPTASYTARLEQRHRAQRRRRPGEPEPGADLGHLVRHPAGDPVGPVRLVPPGAAHRNGTEVLAGLRPGHRRRRRRARRVGAAVLGRGRRGLAGRDRRVRVRHEHHRVQHRHLRPGHHVAGCGPRSGPTATAPPTPRSRSRNGGSSPTTPAPGRPRCRSRSPSSRGASPARRTSPCRRATTTTRRWTSRWRPRTASGRSPDVAPGANAYQSFATRAASVPAGSVTVRATGTVDGKEVTTVNTAAHPGAACA